MGNIYWDRAALFPSLGNNENTKRFIGQIFGESWLPLAAMNTHHWLPMHVSRIAWHLDDYFVHGLHNTSRQYLVVLSLYLGKLQKIFLMTVKELIGLCFNPRANTRCWITITKLIIDSFNNQFEIISNPYSEQECTFVYFQNVPKFTGIITQKRLTKVAV